MSLQTESPVAKARREQALRNILASRRRKQALRRRTAVSVTSDAVARGSSSRRKSHQPRETGSSDLLEMQESQNGLYVTVPEQHSINDTQDIVIETLGLATTATSSSSNGGRRSGTMSISSKPYRNNASMEHRVKKIVSMPASLYNHFRPVESNIPIEDMSQFLYFGQKLRGTGMAKDTSSMSPASKKLLLAGLEDMLDDDMNSVDNLRMTASTKIRKTSLREQTTRPVCPDKITEARRNSINGTEAQKNQGTETSLGLRIIVTEAPIRPISTMADTLMYFVGNRRNTTQANSMALITTSSMITTPAMAATSAITTTTTPMTPYDYDYAVNTVDESNNDDDVEEIVDNNYRSSNNGRGNARIYRGMLS
ncbi:PREDICTED: uncharacterized protein LOC105369064 [Ceratosolen solmsi marchali]|uniref:Uncharacterized protein LOC105369064 n=1 Tax=Ceratosolen solmsi marchali TaxID=326594 RepID=A0AAJ7E3L1_9HYME|nr:PREDICTED: uncharacterized protein LOC105369064 [Ceratosolen solmsi marchali]